MTVAGTKGIQTQTARKPMFVFHCLPTSMATKKHASCFVGVLFNNTFVPPPSALYLSVSLPPPPLSFTLVSCLHPNHSLLCDI